MNSNRQPVLCAVLLLFQIHCAQCASVSDLTYEIVNGEVIIKACNENASGSLVIPDSIEGLPVTTIDWEYVSDTSESIPVIYKRGAFEDCDLLTSIVVPDSITTINENAFRKCDSLQTIVLGRSINQIGETAFGGCVALTSITVDDNNENYQSIDGVLYNESRTTLIAFPGSKGGNYTVDPPVQSIASEAFYGCHSLTSLGLPETLVDIGNYAFKECQSLTGIVLPEGVTVLGILTFQDCISLGSAIIPHSLTHLPIGCFWGCVSLQSFVVPDNIQTMGHSVFMNCSNLSAVSLPAQMTTIAESTFENCDSLQEITIPPGIVKIDVLAFYDCDSLLALSIPASVQEIGYAAFDSCASLRRIDVASENQNYSSRDGVFYSADATRIINFPGGRAGFFRIPDGVTTIDIAAFEDCRLLTHLVCPPSLNLIESFAFNNCEALRHIVFLGDLPSIHTHIRWWEEPPVSVGAFDSANPELEFFLFQDAYGSDHESIEGHPVRILFPQEDFDHDGLSNEEERMFGTSPASGASRFSMWLAGNRLWFSNIRESVSIYCYWSLDLVQWNALDIEPTGRPYEGGFDLPPFEGPPFYLSSGQPLFFKVVVDE